MSCILYAKEPMVLINNMDTYFKNTPPDCTLFSKDNDEIWVHKELLFQTKYLRDMLKSVSTDSKIEVICPSLTTEELKTIVDFLYCGKVFCENQISVSQVSKNLMDLFGFPLISNEVEDVNESMVLPSSRKKPRKQSLNSALIRDDVPEMTIKVEPDLNNHIADMVKVEVIEDFESIQTRNFSELNPFPENNSSFLPISLIKKEIVPEEDEQSFHVHEEKNVHVQSVHKDKPRIKCSLCDRHYQGNHSLRAHMRKFHGTVHEKKKPYNCQLCDAKFGGKFGLKSHIKFKHENLELTSAPTKSGGSKKCPVCKEVHEFKASMIKHITNMHPEFKLYKCSFCDKKYLYVGGLTQHESNIHPEQVLNSSGKHVKRRGAGIKKCPVCKETFEFRSFLIKHLRSNHEDFKIYDCSQCDKNFLTLQGQMYHMFHNHERKTNELGCCFCGKDFVSKEALKNHKLTEHKEKKYQCFKCDASYLSESTLQYHIEHVHEGKKFQCSICGEVFQSDHRLETHVKLTHDRSKLFECPTCQANFVTEKRLAAHVAYIHDKVSGHLCTLCGKNYQMKSHLMDHIYVVHEGNKHECQFCGKTYSGKQAFKRHMKVHEGTKKLVKCALCDKDFGSNAAMKRHVAEVHEKKRPHLCSLCDSRFAQGSQLKTHIKGVHKNVTL